MSQLLYVEGTGVVLVGGCVGVFDDVAFLRTVL